MFSDIKKRYSDGYFMDSKNGQKGILAQLQKHI